MPALERPLVSVEKAEGVLRGDRAFFDVTPREVDLYDSKEGRDRKVVEWLGYDTPKAA